MLSTHVSHKNLSMVLLNVYSIFEAGYRGAVKRKI